MNKFHYSKFNDEDGNTPLMLKISNFDNVEVLKELNNEVDLLVQNKYNRTALDIAKFVGNKEVEKIIALKTFDQLIEKAKKIIQESF